MRKIFYTILLLFPISMLAQITVKGKIMDKENNPLPGASVLIQGTTKGAMSDFNGLFSIDLSKTPSTLIFSYLGYETKEVIITNQKELSIVLSEDSEQLEEIVIIGYGSSTKSDVTAAITTVKPNVENKAGVAVAESILKGVSGLNVLSNGEPGAAVSINIRGISSLSGSNQPLYVIDGIVMDSAEEFLTDPTNFQNASKSGIGGVAPEDIESIQILKDASATAIYGSLGANGVILITTKSGKKGAPKFTYSSSATVGSAVIPYDLLNTEDYVGLMSEKYKLNPNSIAGQEYQFPEGRSPIELREDGLYNFLNRNDEDNDGELDLIGVFEARDWQNLYRNTFSTNNRLNISGGTDKTTYYASLGYLKNEGVVPSVYLERLDLNVNLKHTINDKLQIGGKLAFTNSKNSIIGNGGANATENRSIFGQINDEFPLELREDIAPLEDEGFRITPRGWIDEYDNISKENRFIGNFFTKYKITNTLTYDLKIGGDIRKGELDVWQGTGTQAGFVREGRYSFSELNRFSYNIDQTVLFRPKKIGNHRYTLLGGVVYASTDSENKYTRASNYTAEGQLNAGRDFFGATIIETPVINFGPQKLLSFLGRGTYAYKDRYKVSGSLRYDGSSKFVGKNRFGFFPAVSFAWEMHKEKFLKQSKSINELKFRFGYGETGNQRVGSNLTAVNYRISPEGYATSGSLLQAYEKTNIANEDLTWETQKQFNLGFDLKMFSNRLSITLDAYDKTSDDLLNTLSIGGSSGDDVIVINQGSISNKGIELAINGNVFESENFTWNLYGTYTKNKVEILNLGLEEAQFGAAGSFVGYFGRPIQVSSTNTVPTNVYLNGQAPGLLYGFESDGIITADDIANGYPTINGDTAVEGFYKLIDKNNDGDINNEDKTIIGNPNPDFIVSFGTNVNYKNWSLSADFYGVYGNDIYNANYLTEVYSAENRYNNTRSSYLNNYYNPLTNPTGNLPALNLQKATLDEVGVIDTAVQDGSYLRLQSISLGYTVPLSEKSKIASLKFFASAGNLFTWTNYNGFNPEISSLRFTPGVAGVDIASPPNQKTLTFGASINF
ncbi:SusC/RagA family TonB-linked outer membrane protein [Polaribacter sp. R77954]|uniref:SusC/RagA family TonB-linked outer membrane protein n=1 Tax=Polaribacter sp. R77954 TaxID=3093870 RepID=UPI0037C7A72E